MTYHRGFGLVIAGRLPTPVTAPPVRAPAPVAPKPAAPPPAPVPVAAPVPVVPAPVPVVTGPTASPVINRLLQTPVSAGPIYIPPGTSNAVSYEAGAQAPAVSTVGPPAIGGPSDGSSGLTVGVVLTGLGIVIGLIALSKGSS
jgi:hypothetical protein